MMMIMMDPNVQVCATVVSVMALVYSVALNTFRVWVYEDHGAVDTCMDLVINATPLAISQLLLKYCVEKDICNVRYGYHFIKLRDRGRIYCLMCTVFYIGVWYLSRCH
jgi:hypothetical protein